METFLKLVATDLYGRMKGNLAHTAVVFPNKRASLFFNEYLYKEAGKPIWSPSYITISELFRSMSSWEVADPVKLVCELYKVYTQATHSNETLDNFYFWGELLISDFDDADKNLANTHDLFSNLKELKNLMNDLSYMDKEQEEAIQQFFKNFSIEKRTALKERFISIWDVLGEIYTQFKENLKQQGIAYEGMLYRETMDSFNTDNLLYDTYVFVGFNVLNKVEHKLFKQLKEAGKALFYWDYDEFYMNKAHHEAGVFIKQNLMEFPSPLDASCFNHLDSPKEIHYISSPTENAQARYLPQWIRKNLTDNEKETAIVLCNESLLQPVLHSLPDKVKHVNITMGFPLSQTPVYSFITTLLDMQILGYNPKTGRYQYEQVIAVLKHPYTRRLTNQAELLEKSLTKDNRFYPLPSELQKDDYLEHIFTPTNNNLQLTDYLLNLLQQIAVIYRNDTKEEQDEALNQLYRESLFKAYTTIGRFKTLIEEGELNIQPYTYKRLIVRILSATNIPFHGEPAIGLQVMGVLETRNLDFRHLILLSTNEGQLPKNGGDSSFIPYNLRKAFGMTTIEHKIAVYAYYFYRLLQRAEEVTLMYNNSSDGLNQGEWSRFMLQFLIEWNYPIKLQTLQAKQSPQGSLSITISKTDEVMRKMLYRFSLESNKHAILSPSALNCYMDCTLRFYFKYVAQLKAPEVVSADIDSAAFGRIFHRAAETIYKDLTVHGKVINKEAIESLMKNPVKLESYVDNAFKEIFFHIPNNEKPEYNGTQLISSAVIIRYLKQLLKHDYAYAPFTFEESEKDIYENITIHTPVGDITTRIGGFIDRMDSKDGILRIVDYKTGGNPDTPRSIDSLFVRDKNRSGYIFQTFLYASIMCKLSQMKIAPSLLYIHRAASDDYSPIIKIKEDKVAEEVTDFIIHEDKFREMLQELLEEIFNPDIPFTQTEVEDKCTYCDFKAMCKK